MYVLEYNEFGNCRNSNTLGLQHGYFMGGNPPKTNPNKQPCQVLLIDPSRLHAYI